MAVLASRGVLQAEGQQTLGFLQGLVTNDMRKLENAGPQQPPVYATILTPKGKFLHDIFVFPHPELPDAVLIDVDRAGAQAALQLLNRYKLRRPIAFRDVSDRFSVAAAWGGSAQPQGPWWRPDPRLPGLGFRGLLPAGEAAALNATGEEEFRALRYGLGVAEGEAEIPAGSAAPLDYNVDVLNGVSYTKGCYVGQERNSFTHYRGVIRKRLMPVRLERLPATTSAQEGASASSSRPVHIPAGTEVLDAASGRSVGQLRGVAAAAPAAVSASGAGGASAAGGETLGIAYLKLDSALAAAEGRGELRVTAAASGAQGEGAGGGAAAEQGSAQWRVVPVRPTWWPAEWGHEEAAGAGAAGGA